MFKVKTNEQFFSYIFEESLNQMEIHIHEMTSKLQDEPFLFVKKGLNKDGVPFIGHERYEGMIRNTLYILNC